MGIGLGQLANAFLTGIVCPNESVAEEETLVGGEAVGSLQGIGTHGVMESLVSHHQSAVVSKVFANGKFSVALQSGQSFKFVEVLYHLSGTLLEAFTVLCSPPVVQVSVLVVLAALIVESVGHFMSDDHTDGTIVGCVVSLGVEEGRLQDTCGETDFVGGRVVIGIDGLGRHQPFVAVDGFVDAFGNMVVCAPSCSSHDVFIVALAFINDER